VPEPDLRRAAFGDQPGLPSRALAAAATGSPGERFLAAVLFGAQGRYAAAATLLGALSTRNDPVAASLALSALASHRRQLGGHAMARGLDGAALRLAWPARGPADPDGLDAAGARADALIGLAADNLALGGLAAARRLLARAECACWRSRVRAGWVGAEIELASGNPAAAVAPAEKALGEAAGRGAVRHRAKSGLVLGAALLATQEPEYRQRATELVMNAENDVEFHGLESLIWPAGLLVAELDVHASSHYRSRTTRVLHAVLLRSDPVSRRLADDSPWVPTQPRLAPSGNPYRHPG
jgi:hypothetical protein